MRNISAFLFTVILLVGCGGGGGGGSSQSQVDMAPPLMAPPTIPDPATQEITTRDVQTSDPEEILDAAAQVGESGPGFGSVWQSSGNVSGVSSSFNGQALAVSVSRQNESPIRLDTADEIVGTGTGSSFVGLSGRSSRGWGVLSVTSSGSSAKATIAAIYADWANDDVNDYLAGGYWMHVEGDILAGNLTAVEIGTFVDGPELSSSNPPNMPVQGTASYRGAAAGLYAGIYGTDANVPRGSAEIGDFSGVATFTADFATSTIRGCVGCQGDLELSYVFENSVTGEVYSGTSTSDIQLHLGEAPINSANGMFVSRSVTASSSITPISRSSGGWGGQFSNVPDVSGDPRLVAGTFGGDLTTPGGSRVVYVGAFGAGKQ